LINTSHHKGTDNTGGVKATYSRIHQANPTPKMAVQYCTCQEKEWADQMLCRF